MRADIYSYIASFIKFTLASRINKRFDCLWRDRYMILGENTNNMGYDAHYVYHPAWAARVLTITKPSVHVDISSKIDFVAVLSAFMPVKYYEYRSSPISLSGLESSSADLLHLPFESDSIESLSCMHVIEHIGLGRYGDPLDQDGDLKAIAELKRVVKPGGHLLFVVPVGRKRIQFNAHRIYSYDQIFEYFKDFSLRDFSLIVDEKSGLIKNSAKDFVDKQGYACGCFLFKKGK